MLVFSGIHWMVYHDGASLLLHRECHALLLGVANFHISTDQVSRLQERSQENRIWTRTEWGIRGG